MFTLPNSEDEPLSPIARCYQIAAARGRVLREARERAALAESEATVAADGQPATTILDKIVEPASDD